MSIQTLQFSQPIETAREWARRLVEVESRRSGLSLKAAVAPVARRLKAAPSAVWGLLYRPPSDIGVALYRALSEAVEREIRHEIGALENELATARLARSDLDAGEVAAIEQDLSTLRRRFRAGKMNNGEQAC